MRRLPAAAILVVVFGVGLVTMGAAGLAASEQTSFGESIDTVSSQVTPSANISGVIDSEIAGESDVIGLDIAIDDVTDSVELDLDETAQINVTAVLADGTSESVTDDANITATDSTVSLSNGTVTAEEEGETTVNATYEGETASITVEVVDEEPSPSPPPSPPSPAPPPPSVDLSIISAPDPVTTEETLSVETELAYDGFEEEFTIELRLNGTTVKTDSKTIPSGDTTATFAYDPVEDDIGDRELTVVVVGEDTASAPVSIVPPAGVSTVIDIQPDTATVGETITLSGAESSTQHGEIIGYEWTVDGETLDGETVSVSTDQPGTINIELTVLTDTGETVTTTTTMEVLPEDDTDPESGMPNWLPLIGVVVLLGAGASWWYFRAGQSLLE